MCKDDGIEFFFSLMLTQRNNEIQLQLTSVKGTSLMLNLRISTTIMVFHKRYLLQVVKVEQWTLAWKQ